MLKEERRFQFRERLSQVHPTDIRDESIAKAADELLLDDGLIIRLPNDAGDVILTAARDFTDFLFTSMNVSARFAKKGSGEITLIIDPAYKTYKAFRVETNAAGIVITAHDERGAAQGLFYLEDVMSARHAPYIPHGITERAPLFSPRMTHSGFMLDEFPDSHLAQIAHAGMDAILVMTCGVDESLWGYTDFNDLICRAAKWGLDVYAYSYYRSKCHPDDPGADAHYQSTYGELFRQCPGFKGVVLVGESVGFPTKDPNASPLPYYDNNIGGIPSDKPSADFWPCADYREWLIKLQSIIYKYNPDADIVFWTYNWGYADRKARQDLIRNLPEKVSLLVTFETFEPVALGDNVYEQMYDYTLSYAGPGHYFISEAEVARECGIRLYAMANTGGNTWDMGGVPYEPMPGQWLNRARAVLEAREKYNLCGLMECHQYGFTPSIISEMMKYIFDTGSDCVEDELVRIIRRHYGFGQEAKILEALECWSEAIRSLPASGENQCGAFRGGPSFAFSLAGKYMISFDKSCKGRFVTSKYPVHNATHQANMALSGVRLPYEKQRLETMLSLLNRGCEILESLCDKNTEMLYLINLGHYMECIVTCAINAMRWHVVVTKLNIVTTVEEGRALLDEAEAIIIDERANVLRALPLVKYDSRLGWDPRMEYVCDPARLEWKLKLLDYVQNTEIRQYRASNEFTIEAYNAKQHD
ncbi:MAG: hypothetical protein E7463_02330 [Ruminococcaceae bacterium]|nr:hypothetical protein [Oscillospiraceae bacterium]